MEACFFKASKGETFSLQDDYFNDIWCNHMNPISLPGCYCFKSVTVLAHTQQGGNTQEMGILETTKKRVSAA